MFVRGKLPILLYGRLLSLWNRNGRGVRAAEGSFCRKSVNNGVHDYGCGPIDGAILIAECHETNESADG